MPDGLSYQGLIIILATVIPSALLMIGVAILCYRSRRRKARLFKRGITPIDDEEIQSWKTARNGREKFSELTSHQTFRSSRGSERTHRASASLCSIQKPASVIIYQSTTSHHNPRMSEDGTLNQSTDSFELPPVPVLARAPNSRPGLTDESVEGEDAFIAQSKRHTTVRLFKASPPSPRHVRSKSSRATTSHHDPWCGQSAEHQLPPRRSADTFLPSSYQSSSEPNSDFDTTHLSQFNPFRSSSSDEISVGGLSPRTLIDDSDIGRAIG